VWVHHTPPDQVGEAMHRVLPDPALSLAFGCSREPGGRPAEPRLLLIGPKTRPFVFRLIPGYELTAVRLKLEWVGAVLGLVPAEHRDSQPELSALLPRLAGPTLDRLCETRTPEHALAVLGAEVARALSRGRPGPPGVESRALDLVRAAAGWLTVDQVAMRMGVSPRHLRRTVRRAAGLSLKAYARTLRFLQAVAAADRSPQPAWARIAADAGFCDQSHLVRECRALAGMAPVQVDRERRAESGMSNRRQAC
jgi:AraC-like DNA-binding protein